MNKGHARKGPWSINFTLALTNFTKNNMSRLLIIIYACLKIHPNELLQTGDPFSGIYRGMEVVVLPLIPFFFLTMFTFIIMISYNL